MTVLRHREDVRNICSPSGVCVLRVEPQATGVLITLRMNANIEDAGGERVRTVTEIDSAMKILRSFLIHYIQNRTLCQE